MNKKATWITSILLMCTTLVHAAEFETATSAVKNMGLGWNLGNTLDANSQTITDVTNDNYWGQQGLESETCWGQYVTKPELMRMMKDAGFGAIRVPVTWYNHMDKDGNVDAAWMKRVHEIVDYVINQGMYCIINVHHDTGADSYDKSGNLTGYHWIKADEDNYNTNKARYEKLWKQIAEEFKSYDQLLLFESYNEMLDKLNSWCFASMNASGQYNATVANSAYNAINSYAQSFVNAVRGTGGNNIRRNLIVNTYCASNGYGTWNTHLQEPLTKLKKPSGESSHIAYEIHVYPSIVNGSADRPFTEIKNEVDGMISLLKTNFIDKGVPVIFGEWGTSNVDAAETDYMKRPALMKQFCQYFVKQCKANDIATFYWMGISDGASRLFPAFSQADLAKWLLQAYHGSDFNPTLPERSDYVNSCISCTVNYNQQWAEFNLAQGSFTVDQYIRLELELEEAPESGLLQVKVYGKSETTQDVTATTTKVSFANLGTISRVTLQCKKASGSAKVKNIWLVKKSGEKVPSDPSIFWGCSMTNVNVTTGIQGVINNTTKENGAIYDLRGQKVNNPKKGIYIRNGKKFIQ